MRIIHTSDWHLGRRLYGQARYQEFANFLDWLSDYISHNTIDALLIAGDVFDSNSPSNRAQNLYYDFLNKVAHSPCRHIVIISGNHDSPSFLSAPQALLKDLNIHIVAQLSGNLADEVIALNNAQGELELLVCAVPYLRDRDIRLSQAGESLTDKEEKLKAAVQAHYCDVVAIAETQRSEYYQKSTQDNQSHRIPIVAMGHLFTAGGKTQDGDGVRDLYVGSLAHINAHFFPDNIDYLALGHLHIPQKVGKSETQRYSGSPLAMSFGEAKQQKMILAVHFNSVDKHADVNEIFIPCFQKLCQIRGTLSEILAKIEVLISSDKDYWLEIHYTGSSLHSDLSKQLHQAVQANQHTKLRILRIENRAMIAHALKASQYGHKTLDELSPQQVFQRCLNANNIPDSQQNALMLTFEETLLCIDQADIHAE
jgi:exonuclease SbcD